MENITQRINGRRTVTWAGAQASAEIDISGINQDLKLELPAAFLGTTLTYQVKNNAGTFVALEAAGVAVSDTVSGSLASVNKLTADLRGCDAIKIVSDQSETCTGYLLGSG